MGGRSGEMAGWFDVLFATGGLTTNRPILPILPARPHSSKSQEQYSVRRGNAKMLINISPIQVYKPLTFGAPRIIAINFCTLAADIAKGCAVGSRCKPLSMCDRPGFGPPCLLTCFIHCCVMFGLCLVFHLLLMFRFLLIFGFAFDPGFRSLSLSRARTRTRCHG